MEVDEGEVMNGRVRAEPEQERRMEWRREGSGRGASKGKLITMDYMVLLVAPFSSISVSAPCPS